MPIHFALSRSVLLVLGLWASGGFFSLNIFGLLWERHKERHGHRHLPHVAEVFAPVAADQRVSYHASPLSTPATPLGARTAAGVGSAGISHSRLRSAAPIRMDLAAEPGLVVCMPCGYDLDDSAEQAMLHGEVFELGVPVYAVDASGHFSRPGPRLVDGIEQLAQILHPDLAPEVDTSWVRVEPVRT